MLSLELKQLTTKLHFIALFFVEDDLFGMIHEIQYLSLQYNLIYKVVIREILPFHCCFNEFKIVSIFFKETQKHSYSVLCRGLGSVTAAWNEATCILIN